MTTQAIHRIDLAYPDAAPLFMHFRLGPCRLRVKPSGGNAWIAGTYDDPSGALALDTLVVPGGVTIAQRLEMPSLARAALPVLDLEIGTARPFALTIDAGASESTFDLGGLPLSKLDMNLGAGRYEIDFSSPNPFAMSRLQVGAGAGAITLRHLANANFAELRIGAGMSSWILDLSGDLRRDATARVEAGVTSVEVDVPSTTAARIVTKGFAHGRTVLGALVADGDALVTPAAKEGKRPLLSVEVTMALGSVTLRST
ncbi:MAG TPA: hypothetical protein VFM93_01725 [Candidatus Limnocylindria bacterium]|nr:hypothetical protein [Candidatus Limnocylindria bacterium]